MAHAFASVVCCYGLAILTVFVHCIIGIVDLLP